MRKQRRLGQHFLNSSSVAKLIVAEAEITKKDVVFELGTGLGMLTPLLCREAGRVISVEADKSLAGTARSSLSHIDNLVLKSGDGLGMGDSFSVFVSNLPYSRSRDAIEWLARTSFSRGVIMVQREFAEKLFAVSARDRRAISVIANHALEIRICSGVGRNNFSPPPKIDSVILRIAKRNDMTKEQVQTVNKIFSYRRKTVKNILKQFGIESDVDKRIEELSGDEIIGLADRILEK